MDDENTAEEIPEHFQKAEPGFTAGESKKEFTAALGLIMAGVLIICVTAVLEARWVSDVPWINALIILNDNTHPDNTFPIHTRTIDPADYEEVKLMEGYLASEEEALEKIIEAELLDESIETEEELPEADYSRPLPHLFYEHVISINADTAILEELVEEGRVPEAGKPEVLAGDLSSQKSFMLDDMEFHVVGTLKRGVGATQMCYLIPEDTAFDHVFRNSEDAAAGWLHPEGLLHTDTLIDKESMPELSDVYMGGRTRSIYIWLCFFGLFIIALGGSAAHTTLFRMLSQKKTGLLQPVFSAVCEWPKLLYWCHVVFYAMFFVAMYQGISEPVWSIRLGQLTAAQFTEGELAYIGEAYNSGNYLKAAAATWWNNYVMQTLVLTLGISMVPLGAGLLKTSFSFIMTGFMMPPSQIGSAGGYSYHSITMILELEAYIIACFAVILWMIQFYRAITNNEPYQELLKGGRILLGTAVLTAAMLALAGLYEAVTLIFFAQF